MKKYPVDPSEVYKGQQVKIETNNGEFFEGAVTKIITKQHNFSGVKVEINTGKVGRVRPFVSEIESNNIYLEKGFRYDQNRPEGQKLEFKASFFFDLDKYDYTRKIDTSYDVIHNIAKTIAAFANSGGGTLYVGIRDKPRQILGLQYDYDILKEYENKKMEIKNKNNGDYLSFKCNGELLTALKRAMDQLFCNTYDYRKNTSIHLFNVDGQDLCVIKTKSSKKPLIIRSKRNDQFYVRHTDQSEPYDDVGRFCDYWCDHLCERQP